MFGKNKVAGGRFELPTYGCLRNAYEPSASISRY